jgi:uncharacterized protein (DUF924 family)
MTTPHDVFDFWFKELGPSDWFKSDKDLDQKISDRYKSSLEAAKRGEFFSWRKTPEGRLAEIILLDQFSRNIFRGSKEAFAADSMVLVLAQEMVEQQLDEKLTVIQRSFAYMPYMHSESVAIHQEALRLFSLPGLEENLKFEILHKNIIEKFGRYPHRNLILGRVSTPEEKEFLKTHQGF